MEQLRVFNITTDAENLGEALTGGDGTDPLRSAVGTIAADVTTRALETPLSIYLCSRDCDADLRNRFGFLLAKATLSRVPDTLVVDCDFLSPGLSGLAPSQTTLGFLDLLLYGSSLRVIANKAETGVNVIGAASFPVLQRVPFQTEAFVNTLRYLLSHARCVILLGPVFADTDDLHPIVQQVDLPFIVQSGDLSNARKFEQLEEKIISARDSLVWSIRCLHTVSANDDAETRAEGSAVGAAEDEAVDQILGEAVPLAGSGYDEAAGTTKEASTPEPAQAVELLFAEEGPGARLGEKKANSVFPKVITSFLGVFLIGFLLWWLYLTKSFRNDVDETAGPAPPTAEHS
ncbi:MAG: hypothetical protein OEN01_12230, partial [Candidatus Krumholzibacteria bacterium]|nr:hypothetical protein [Candidatus Krumholzibacteria bacterium]